MPKVQPADDAFLASAPLRLQETFAIPRPAAEVWADLQSDDTLHWCRAVSVRWTSPRPFAVGTTRTAKVLGGVITVKERFRVWEEGRRIAFEVTSANVPVFRRLTEDFLVEPDGDAACTLTWTVGVEPTLLGKAAGPVNALLFKSLFADTRTHYGVR